LRGLEATALAPDVGVWVAARVHRDLHLQYDHSFH
jgi:hypothetical protein